MRVRKLKEEVRELEGVKGMLGSATGMRDGEENMVASLKTEFATGSGSAHALQRAV